jgi:hypothetical protein
MRFYTDIKDIHIKALHSQVAFAKWSRVSFYTVILLGRLRN